MKCIHPLAAAAALAATSFALPAAAQFHRLEAAVKLQSAAPDWDYLSFDPARSYLFIAARADGVIVYDAKTKKLVRTIEQSHDANATVLVPEFDRGYTVNEDGTTTAFRLSSLTAIKRTKFAEAGDSGAYEPVTRQVVFTVSETRELVFLDAESGATTGRLKIESGKPEFPTPDGRGHLYLGERDRDAVLLIDAKERKIVAEWKTEGCAEPNGVALDRTHKRLFIGCRGRGINPVLAVLDAESGKVITTLPIGRGNDGVIYDPDTRKVYASGGVDANLVVYQQVDADRYKLAEATTTRPYARTMALDPTTKKVYLVTAEGTVDPTKKVNQGPAPFYPNRYFPETFTLLIYAPK